ncbi:MAG: hypothetical protein FJ096_21440 [Deltaproteobacteria bacterium]|nr:hypothetical protein [Deltaproteobacteria bacterium]
MLGIRRSSFGTLAFTSALLGIALPVACGGDESSTLTTSGTTVSSADTGTTSQAASMMGAGGSTLQFMDGPMTAGAGGDIATVATATASTGTGEGGTGTVKYGWDMAFGGTNAMDVVSAYDVAVDKNGDIIVVGSFRGNIDFDGNGASGPVASKGDFDAFIAKYSSTGMLKWLKTAGAGDPQTANAVTVDKDNRVGVCGTFRGAVNFGGNNLQVNDGQYSDAFAVVFDSDGNHIASQRYGGNTLGKSDLCAGAAFDATGNLIITGQSQGQVNFGTTAVGDNNGDFKIYLAKLTPNMGTKGFNEVFAKAFVSPGVSSQGSAVANSMEGDIALGGSTEGPIQLGGVTLTPKTAGVQQAIVGRYDATGAAKFTKMFLSEGNSQVTSVAFHTNGDMLVGGTFRDSIDFGNGPVMATGPANDVFVARFDKSNKLVYGVRIGDAATDDLSDLALDSAGFPVFAGSFQGTPTINSKTTLMAKGLRDGMVVKLAPDDGHGYWGLGFGDTDFQEARGIAVNAQGSVIFVGNFKGTVDFGGGLRIAPNGSQSAFIGSLLP